MGFNFLNIVPEPQSSKTLGRWAPVTGYRVEGDLTAAGKSVARAVENAFKDNGLAESGAAGEGTLVLSFEPVSALTEADCKEVKCDPAVLETNEESYALKVQAEGGALRARVYAAHERGRFYGVKTVKKLLMKHEGKRIDPVLIFDHPDFPVRGVIEGYYGKPWKTSDTFKMIDWMADQKMNIFLYAPKDDPKNRNDWRSPYTDSELERFRKFNALSKIDNMQFCWEISPGLSIKYSSEKDFELLMNKFYQAADAGVTCFVLAFDDTGKTLGDEGDKARYPRGMGEAQADLTNRAYEATKKRVPDAKFSFVPVEYWNDEVTEEYSGTVGDILHPDIVYGWTGDEICSYAVTNEDAKFIAGYINRKPMLGDNIPVVDTFGGQKGPIHLGPLTRRSKDLHLDVTGFTANAMPWVFSSKINLATVADYAWNPKVYDAMRSWKNGIVETVGLDAYSVFKPFAVLNQGSLVNHHDSEDLAALFDKFWLHYRAGDLSAVKEEFSSYFRNIAAIQRNIQEKVKDPELLDELSSWLSKAAVYGELGREAVEAADLKLKGALTEEKWKSLEEGVKRALRKPAETTRKTMPEFFKTLLEELSSGR